MNWNGVIPAITTPFREDMSVDHEFFTRHCQWQIENGCAGVVALGSLGEGATLTFDEKQAVLKTAVAAIGPNSPVVAGVSALSTDEAVRIAKMAADAGCSGLMVLPPYVYCGDWREMKAHVGTVIAATKLPCMLYNNPVAYKTDFIPEQVGELLAEHENLVAIKESSADVRRVASLRALAGNRLKILVGVDDLIFEAALAGAVGWIAGLVNAFPAESVALFDASVRGDKQRAFEIYKWFLPLLRMDTVPKFVQLIKLAQQEVGMGNARVRAPRMELTGAELAEAKAVIAQALATRP
ncbi:dihydrodipicolinate synthase family protein [uncultured Paludibaculum sp.]|uniref:dihydrodipicolinate synthase family protein n=1 Tax=uncultured Paludibaculum sp. TaxID=1765020 RepID=UPI002AAB78D2|nr:dihydrodipicolinate synthase family protein [uncultured Paludibaculum sp.]